MKKTISLKVTSGLAAVSFVVMTVAPPARAHVVEAVATIPATSGGDKQELEGAIQAAIDDVVTHAIALTPTVVTLLDAKLVADRVYLFVLVADRDGEESLRLLLAERPAARPDPPPADSGIDAGRDRVYR